MLEMVLTSAEIRSYDYYEAEAKIAEVDKHYTYAEYRALEGLFQIYRTKDK